MGFKVGDKVFHFSASGNSTPDEVKEVDAIGNIRISAEYPPKFHHKNEFVAQERCGGAISPIQPGGVKFDQDKPDMSLLSSIAMVEVAKVMTFGKKKYSANNWRGGFAWTRPLSACLRHVFAFIGGEDKDPETGLCHLAHAICCLMFVLEFIHTGSGTDDRYKKQ